jgi:hypothetical protein
MNRRSWFWQEELSIVQYVRTPAARPQTECLSQDCDQRSSRNLLRRELEFGSAFERRNVVETVVA